MNKLAVFDLDSTLLDGESINIVLNQILHSKSQKEALEMIRTQGMAGEILLKVSLQQRTSFFRGLQDNQLYELCQLIPWTNGAFETIAHLKQQGYFTLCLSSGFRSVTRRVMIELNMDAYCSNTLEVCGGRLTGKMSGNLMHHDSKGLLLDSIQKELGITPENTVVVGDGANDLSMFDVADTCIAFCGQEILKSRATHIVNVKDLREILVFTTPLS